MLICSISTGGSQDFWLPSRVRPTDPTLGDAFEAAESIFSGETVAILHRKILEGAVQTTPYPPKWKMLVYIQYNIYIYVYYVYLEPT